MYYYKLKKELLFTLKQAGGKRNENLNDILLVFKFRNIKCELFIYVKEGHI